MIARHGACNRWTDTSVGGENTKRPAHRLSCRIPTPHATSCWGSQSKSSAFADVATRTRTSIDLSRRQFHHPERPLLRFGNVFSPSPSFFGSRLGHVLGHNSRNAPNPHRHCIDAVWVKWVTLFSLLSL